MLAITDLLYGRATNVSFVLCFAVTSQQLELQELCASLVNGLVMMIVLLEKATDPLGINNIQQFGRLDDLVQQFLRECLLVLGVAHVQLLEYRNDAV